jgi:WD40 repeat protein
VDGVAHGIHSPFARDGRAFVTASGDTVVVWDSATLRPLTGPLAHPKLRFYRLVRSGETLLTASDSEVRIWDVTTGRLRSTTALSKRTLALVEFAADGRQFITIERDREDAGRLWRINNGAFTSTSLAAEAEADAAEFDPTGRWIVTHLWGEPFHVWSAETGHEVCPPIRSTDGWFRPYRARFDAAGRRLVVPQEDGFTVVDPQTWETVCRCRLEHGDRTNRVVFNAAGTQIIVTALHELSPAPVRVFAADTGKLLQTFGQTAERCQLAAGGFPALCVPLLRTKAETPSVWDPGTDRLLQNLPHVVSPDVYVSGDGTTILLETEPGHTSVWRRQIKNR